MNDFERGIRCAVEHLRETARAMRKVKQNLTANILDEEADLVLSLKDDEEWDIDRLVNEVMDAFAAEKHVVEQREAVKCAIIRSGWLP